MTPPRNMRWRHARGRLGDEPPQEAPATPEDPTVPVELDAPVEAPQIVERAYQAPEKIQARTDATTRDGLARLAQQLGTVSTSEIIRVAIGLAVDRTNTVPDVITQQAFREGFRAGFAHLRQALAREADTFEQRGSGDGS